MGFIANIIGAIVDVIVAVVEIVVQIVEVIIELIMTLLGFKETTQVIEYFEVYNLPLFNDVDNLNPLSELVKETVLGNQDIAQELVYSATFREYKGDIQNFMDYIEDGNYIEGFPDIESYITYPDYDELTAVLLTLEGVPCTIEHAYTRALKQTDWIEYWLQENKGYSFEDKTVLEIVNEFTTAGSGTDTVVTGGTSPNLTITINDYVGVADNLTGNMALPIDLATIVYNSGPDNYSVDVFDTTDTYTTLPYTIPSKPLGLHYVTSYYLDSAPLVTYSFIYLVGTGTYPDLDNPVNQINIDATVLKAIPAIPLRLNNVDYTSRPADEVIKIDELGDLVSLDLEELLDAIKNDPQAPEAGDLDHVYVNFGVRLWDTTQVGMSYLYNMCENLFPAQGVTKGIYDASPPGDDKPQNNIIITTDDYKYLFQWSYLSYEFTPLEDIDADSGSEENGYYYSDLSKFDSDGILRYNYYVSSGKGTYNVGYQADDLAEVQAFLDGSGVPNSGTTTTEAANWLQVTTRMAYNNPSPVLEDADGTVSELVFLTGDLVYENNGSGVLRHVEQASEETTAGQSITYYHVTPEGLEAYTMTAPIGSLRVVDGESGKFKMVKFNLGNRDDLMAPFIHNFIADLPNKEVTQLFLVGAHASMYIAHYEVIVQRPSLFAAIVAIIIIVIIIVIAWYFPPAWSGAGSILPGVVYTAGHIAAPAMIAWGATALNILVQVAVSQLVKLAITAVFGDSPVGQLLGAIAGMAVGSAFGYSSISGSFTVDFSHITAFDPSAFFSDWGPMDTFGAAMAAIEFGGSVIEARSQDRIDDLQGDYQDLKAANSQRLLDLTNKETALRELQEGLFGTQENAQQMASLLTQVSVRAFSHPTLAEHMYSYMENLTAVLEVDSEYDVYYQQKVSDPLGWGIGY